jgi:hypothetical protein
VHRLLLHRPGPTATRPATAPAAAGPARHGGQLLLVPVDHGHRQALQRELLLVGQGQHTGLQRRDGLRQRGGALGQCRQARRFQRLRLLQAASRWRAWSRPGSRSRKALRAAHRRSGRACQLPGPRALHAAQPLGQRGGLGAGRQRGQVLVHALQALALRPLGLAGQRAAIVLGLGAGQGLHQVGLLAAQCGPGRWSRPARRARSAAAVARRRRGAGPAGRRRRAACAASAAGRRPPSAGRPSGSAPAAPGARPTPGPVWRQRAEGRVVAAARRVRGRARGPAAPAAAAGPARCRPPAPGGPAASASASVVEGLQQALGAQQRFAARAQPGIGLRHAPAGLRTPPARWPGAPRLPARAPARPGAALLQRRPAVGQQRACRRRCRAGAHAARRRRRAASGAAGARPPAPASGWRGRAGCAALRWPPGCGRCGRVRPAPRPAARPAAAQWPGCAAPAAGAARVWPSASGCSTAAAWPRGPRARWTWACSSTRSSSRSPASGACTRASAASASSTGRAASAHGPASSRRGRGAAGVVRPPARTPAAASSCWPQSSSRPPRSSSASASCGARRSKCCDTIRRTQRGHPAALEVVEQHVAVVRRAHRLAAVPGPSPPAGSPCRTRR